MGLFISRQRNNDGLYVEIAVGGPKKAGQNILPKRYEGEGKNLVDPRDAVKNALSIYKHWDRDYFDEFKKINVLHQDFQGGSKQFDPRNKREIESLQKWAEAMFATMDKCAACKIPMGNKVPYESPDIGGSVFCTEVCLARKYRDMYGVEPVATKIIKKK